MGLSKVEELYQNRSQRVEELKAGGKKIIGYLCSFTPVEFLTGVGVVPYRLMGDVSEPITLADAHIDTLLCPFVRSFLDLVLKERYDFLDGLVVPHTCDGIERNYDLFRHHLNPSYSFYLNVPHVIRPASYEFFKEELVGFKRSIEEFGGKDISQEELREAVELHNNNRALVRELYSLRKKEPPLISGAEVTRTLVCALSLPVEEANELLRSVIQEVREREDISLPPGTRLLIYGSEIDDTTFIELVESCGAKVVMDDLCIGTRHYWHDVELTEDPIEGLASRYLEAIRCPRTLREGKPPERFQYLLDYARDFGVEGVLFYILRFCDTHAFDVPDARDYLQEMGLPVLHLESDYSLTSIGQFRTKVQAFVEMIEGRRSGKG